MGMGMDICRLTRAVLASCSSLQGVNPLRKLYCLLEMPSLIMGGMGMGMGRLSMLMPSLCNDGHEQAVEVLWVALDLCVGTRYPAHFS